MAMDANTLGDAMKAAVDAVVNKQDSTAVYRAIAGAIIGHIQSNATVIVKTTDGGLQRDADGSHPDTLAPSTNKTLPAGCIS